MVVGWALARGGRRHAPVFLEVVFLPPGRGVLGAPRVTRAVGGGGGGRDTGSSRRCGRGKSVFSLVTAGVLVNFLPNLVIFLTNRVIFLTNLVIFLTNLVRGRALSRGEHRRVLPPWRHIRTRQRMPGRLLLVLAHPSQSVVGVAGTALVAGVPPDLHGDGAALYRTDPGLPPELVRVMLSTVEDVHPEAEGAVPAHRLRPGHVLTAGPWAGARITTVQMPTELGAGVVRLTIGDRVVWADASTPMT